MPLAKENHGSTLTGSKNRGGGGCHACWGPDECCAASLIFCPLCPSCFPVAIPILLFFLLGNPYERGFNCDDESLRYPYKDSTVSTFVLYVVGTFLPAISVSWWVFSYQAHSSILPTLTLSFQCWACLCTSLDQHICFSS